MIELPGEFVFFAGYGLGIATLIWLQVGWDAQTKLTLWLKRKADPSFDRRRAL